MSDGIIIAIISAGIPTIATAITAVVQGRTATRNSAKSDILQMILEDKLANIEGHLPTNYQNIVMAYDRYHKHGGDSYITDKTEDYKKWFAKVEKQRNERA